ncbi:ankyrin repeat-containing domain protein [Aspergillus terricola var. indicus]
MCRPPQQYGDLFIEHFKKPFGKAAANGREDVVEILLQRCPTLDEDGKWLRVARLRNAARQGVSRTVADLIGDQMLQLNVADRDQYKPLHHAVENGHYEIVVLLANSGRNIGINERCNPNGRSYGLITPRSPLCLATFHGNTAIANRLLQCEGIYIEARGALLNDREVTALEIATELGHHEIVDQISGFTGNIGFHSPSSLAMPSPSAFSALENPDILDDFNSFFDDFLNSTRTQ